MATATERDRFQEAKDRYNASMSARNQNTERMEGERSPDTNLLDFLKKRESQKPSVNINVDKKDDALKLPVPLPVVPIDNTALMEQIKTNDNLVRLNKNIVAKLPQPLPIDDSRISSETTLRSIDTRLANLIDKKLPEIIAVYNNQIKTVNGVNDNIEKIVTGEEEKIGGVARNIGGLRDWLKGLVKKAEDPAKAIGKALSKNVVSVGETIAKAFKPATINTKKSTEYLNKLVDVAVKQYNKDSQINSARNLITHQQLGFDDSATEQIGALKGLGQVLFPEGSKAREVIKFTKATADFFNSIGQNLSSGIFKNLNDASSKTTKVFAFIGPILPKFVTNFLSVFSTVGRLGVLLGSIAGVLATSAVYAALKNPEQLAGYLKAFGRIIYENLLPTFKWIVTELGPVFALLSAAIMWVADKVMDTVGTWINTGAIYLLGTVIPDILTAIGRTIDALWQGLKGFALRIAGIFGYGPHGDKGFFTNLGMAFVSLVDGILEAVSVWTTEFLGTFVNLEVFGLREGETLWGRIKRFFTEDLYNLAVNGFNYLKESLFGVAHDMIAGEGDDTIFGRIKRFFTVEVVNFVSNAFDEVKEYIGGLSPVQIMKEKILDMVNAVTGIIPSFDDIKLWIADSIPSWVPDTLRGYLLDKLSPAASDAIDYASEKLTNIKEFATPHIENATNKFNDLKDHANPHINNAQDYLYDKALDLKVLGVENIPKALQKIDETLEHLDTGEIKGKVNDLYGSAEERASSIADRWRNAYTPVKKTVKEHPLNPWSNYGNQSAPVVIAPQTSNSSTTVIGGGSSGTGRAPIGRTRPNNDPLNDSLIRANPY